MHSTPERYMSNFNDWIQKLKINYNLYSPDIFDSLLNENHAITNWEKPGVVFTFDDGLRNNRYALQVLEQNGIFGLLFVVPAFYRCPQEEQQQYYRKNIRSEFHAGLDGGPDEVQALNAEELRYWAQRGHVLGAHSYSHTMSENDSDEKAELETKGAIDAIELDTGFKIRHFCAPFDSLLSTGKHHMDILKNHVQFYHSTFPGSNIERPDPLFIKRVNVELFWKQGAIDFACSRFEWRRWAKRRTLFSHKVLENQVAG